MTGQQYALLLGTPTGALLKARDRPRVEGGTRLPEADLGDVPGWRSFPHVDRFVVTSRRRIGRSRWSENVRAALARPARFGTNVR